jgi:hypothetical protein
MLEALDHDWLIPSSQVGESQLNRLGGDSVWSIESFDPDDSRSEEDDERWEASKTNFEDAPSDGSFSQPMGELQIGILTPPLTAEEGKRGTSPTNEGRPKKSRRI